MVPVLLLLVLLDRGWECRVRVRLLLPPRRNNNTSKQRYRLLRRLRLLRVLNHILSRSRSRIQIRSRSQDMHTRVRPL